MADGTNIEWTDATWNVITGCTVTSPGCTNCYAMRLAGTRLASHPSRAGLTREVNGNHVWNGTVRFNDQWLLQPLRWSKPRMIFVCAHGDPFHRDVPDEWILRTFAVMIAAPQHIYQVLTKRSDRMRKFMQWLCETEQGSDALIDAVEGIAPETDLDFDLPAKHIWLGVSAENQTYWDGRVDDLRQTPAAVRWVSVEPMLGPVYDKFELDDIDWIVLGGENGPRPMHPGWARMLRDQSASCNVPFMFKQWGSWAPLENADGYWPTYEDKACRINLAGVRDIGGWPMQMVGKGKAGRLLDGREHNGYPEVSRGD